MDFEEQLQILKRAQGDPARLALAAVDLAYGHLPETERARIREALLAAAVPHSFDAAFLAAAMDTRHEEGERLLAQLRQLEIVEPAPIPGKNVARVAGPVRVALRMHLCRGEPGSWREYSRHAAKLADRDPAPSARIEAVYHLFASDPGAALDYGRKLDEEFRRGRADLRQALHQALEELAHADWPEPEYRDAARRLANAESRPPAASPAPPPSGATERRGVFISYRHENEAHSHAVRRFAERLQEGGLPVEMDQLYLEAHPAGPNEGWAKWAEDRANQSDAVLVIASPGWLAAYAQTGAPGQAFGAATEAGQLRQTLYENIGVNPRVRFVELETSGDCQYPAALEPWPRFRLTRSPEVFEELVAWLNQRLAIDAIPKPHSRTVYLAESYRDERGLRASLEQELREAGWEVLPDHPFARLRSIEEIKDALRESLFFIQLLEEESRNSDRRERLSRPPPDDLVSKDSSSDRDEALRPEELEYNLAVEMGLKTLRFRDPDMNLAGIKDPRHRAFLTADPFVRTTQFDEFKKEVIHQLGETWDRWRRVLPQASARDSRPVRLTRVILCSGEAESHWKRLSEQIMDERDIVWELIGDDESRKGILSARQQQRPCQGFLLLCDDATLQEPKPSSDGILRECLEIQLGEKSRSRSPCVGVVLWGNYSRESGAWSQLLRFKPAKLVRMMAANRGDPPSLTHFLAAVREVAL